jgi:Serine dehydrogenase proteinase
VFVRHYAMSGGTLIALAAEEIVMASDAVLGRVDSQIGQSPAASVLTVIERKKPEDIDDQTLIVADVSRKAITQLRRTAGPAASEAGRLSWAALLKRVFALGLVWERVDDLLSGPGGGGLVGDADVEEFSAVVAEHHEIRLSYVEFLTGTGAQASIRTLRVLADGTIWTAIIHAEEGPACGSPSSEVAQARNRSKPLLTRSSLSLCAQSWGLYSGGPATL